jgi:hypothetical protein
MEQAFVQMVRVAVVAEVQAEDFETAREQARRGELHVARIRAAFPAVQQQRQATRSVAGDGRVEALQSHTVASVDDGGGRGRTHRRQARRPRRRRIALDPNTDCRCGLRSKAGGV